jgi:hypothetical protein
LAARAAAVVFATSTKVFCHRLQEIEGK